MRIGVPKEIKNNENRIAMTPAGVEALVADGHEVMVQAGGGLGSGISDAEFKDAGAKMVKKAADIFAEADMIVKVKEPLAEEYGLIRRGQILYTYFHFAASRELTMAMIETGAVCIAYETVEDAHGHLPLLTPMSEVAGRLSIQEGAKYLEKPMGGRGVLLGGVPGVPPAEVAVLGGGVVGTNAAKIAAGMGANVVILDVSLDRLRYLDDVMPANVKTLYSNKYNILGACRRADLVIGAVLIPGAKAPFLVTRATLKEMKEGSVLVDVAVDQGGCAETTRPTTHSEPTFVVDGVVHYCVANMPGAVARTSTFALTNATLPYARTLAGLGWRKAIASDRGILTGANVVQGKVTCKGVAEAFGLDYHDPARLK
ncbi:MAG: alanine dehydrogenase [Planctomycetaceae bacterium]|nr:alanine dehydrogenase [Planctomycetota bacterium]NUN52032.1 alanine dehydrogenase [Planctomycetaceae bacterium]